MSLKPPFIAFIALGAAACAAHAQSGIADLAQPRRMDAYTEAMDFYSSNPGVMCLADTVSLSKASLSAETEDLDGPVQIGTSRKEAVISASSYRRIGTSSAVWGRASFTAAKTLGVKYADCIDYLRVAPYVLGDSVGGSLAAQRYEFAGGYSGVKGRWTLGADFSYRAETAHRNVDPRVRDIVSDLSMRVGAAWHASARFRLGVAASLNIYNQDCDLTFYNPINDINTHAYSGLGQTYKRFEGNTNKSSGYHSIGYGLSAMLAPSSLAGPRILIEYNGYRMPEQLRSYNSLVLGFTSNHLARATVAYRMSAPRITVEPAVNAGCFLRTGTENIFGSAEGTGYQAIGTRSPYSHRICAAEAACLVQLRIKASFLSVKPSVSLQRTREVCKSPSIAKEVRITAPFILARYSAAIGRWLLEADAACSYAFGGGHLAYGARLAASLAAGRCLPGLAASITHSSLSASFTITL